jgi:chromosome partitioning protein
MKQSPNSIRPPQIIAVTNNKGGVGKTTTTLNVAAELAHRGYRTLLIDLDMQANATTGLFKRGAPGGRTVGMGLLNEAAAAELITKTSLENLFLLPANIHLAKQSEELYRQEGYEQRLKQLLVPIAADYDFVIIDSCYRLLGAL